MVRLGISRVYRVCLVAFGLAFAQSGQAAFTAYNDMAWISGQVSNRITTNAVPTSGFVLSGNLVDYTSAGGTTVSARVSLQMMAGNGVWGTIGVISTAPNMGSDAANIFDGKVDCNMYLYWSTGTVRIIFSNLNRLAKYDVVLYGNRGSSNYLERWTQVAISDVTSFSNRSSTGATISSAVLNGALTNDVTRIITGWNSAGRVFRYDNINPGADSDIVFEALGPATNSTYLNAFMLLEHAVPALPVISNSTAIVVGSGSATVSANLVSTGSLPTEVWLYWRPGLDGTNDKSSWQGSAYMGYRSAGLISTNISALMSDTTYYGRYYASNALGGVWASPSIAFTTLLPPALSDTIVINEIMYQPYEPWPTNQPAKTVNDTEYIELYNDSTNAVDLTDYRLDQGVNFNFALGTRIGPTGYLVVCRNLVAFTNHYPGVTNGVVGNFSGGLSDGGERVTLSRKVAEVWVTADTIQYVDGGTADGTGPSLELVNPGFANFDDQYDGAWLASSSTNGTPGRINGAYQAAPLPVVGRVKHEPALPPPNSSITVTARAGSAGTSTLQSVTLNYRKDQIPATVWSLASMSDNGADADEVADDGIYSVRLPAYGQPGFPSGTLLEFTITASDGGGRSSVFPITNIAGVVTGKLSYLCYFGEDTFSDCAYPGEYETYHVLMTSANTNWLCNRGIADLDEAAMSNGLMDATFIDSTGEIYYNCAVRYRGNKSRIDTPHPVRPYKIRLPPGRTVHGFGELNLNNSDSLGQYVANKLLSQMGHGVEAVDVRLVRYWMNDQFVSQMASQQIYVDVEGIDSAMVERHGASTPLGNIYSVDSGGSGGDYRWLDMLEDYMYDGYVPNAPAPLANDGMGYDCETNNPYRAYHSLSNFCWQLQQDPSQYPTSLTNVMDTREWGRLYASMICFNNGEAGITSPEWTHNGDENFVYAGKDDNEFRIFAWDMSNVLTGMTFRVWDWSHPVISKLLYNPPVAGYYAGDCVDIMNTVMASNNMVTLLDSMGSKVTPSIRNTCLSFSERMCSIMRTKINTNMVVMIHEGATYTGQPLYFSSNSVHLVGMAAQNYTQRVRVNNGVGETEYKMDWSYSYTSAPFYVANTNRGTGRVFYMWVTNVNWFPKLTNWSTVSNMTLPSTFNEIKVTAVDDAGATVKSLTVPMVVRLSTTTNRVGALVTNATWNGYYVVTGNLSVASNATLSLAAGSVVQISPGMKLNIGGTLKLLGTSNRWVTVLSSGNAWTIQATGSASVVTGAYVRTFGGRIAATNGAQIALSDARMSDYFFHDGILSASTGTSVRLSRVVIENYARTVFTGASLYLYKVRFAGMTNCAADLTLTTVNGALVTASSPQSLVADGLRFNGGCGGSLSNCDISGFAGGAGVRVGGSSDRILLHGSVIYDCATGIYVTASAASTNSNVTVSDCFVGMQGAGILQNSILWDNDISISNGAATVSYSDVQMSMDSTYAGAGSINRRPMFMDAGDHDFRLQSNSPCVLASSSGTAIGALYPCGAAPAFPTALVVSGLLSNEVDVSWIDQSNDEDVFEVQRRTMNGKWITVTNLPTNSISYHDSTVLPETTYLYRVRAVNGRGASLYAPAATAQTPRAQTVQTLVDCVRITEIMYNPSGVSDAEFIELKNVGSESVDLNGCYFDGTPQRYTFTNATVLNPGEFWVLVRNGASFASRYPGVAYHALYADINDGLNNAGETVYLRTSTGTDVASVDYLDVAPWPEGADGQGYSLVLVNEPAPAPYDAARWRASSETGGSPGSNDPASSASSILINEVLTHQDRDDPGDWIELYNPTAAPVDMGGWYLSDNPEVLTNYRIPSNTMIAAYGYQVFNEFGHFGTNALGTNSGFGLSELGDNVFLSSGDASGRLTSYRTSASLGACDRDITLGRVERTDGMVDFSPLIYPTMGSANANVQVGPVVINEVMYNPVGSGVEFVEFYNNSATNVLLYDALNPENVWQMKGGVDFVFPAGASLPAGGYLLVVGCEPDAFRRMYGVDDAAVQVMGPFTGLLSGSGDTIKLHKPGMAELLGYLPYITMDLLNYDDIAPWPEQADGNGASLERRSVTAYGNDPTNWMAMTSGGTPGRANNVDGRATVGFDASAGTSLESNGVFKIKLKLSAPSPIEIVTTLSVGGTATAGSDYQLAGTTLTFWPYETNKNVVLTIVDDAISERDETVELTLVSAGGEVQIGGTRTYVHTIIDRDGVSVSAPVISPAGTTYFTNWILVTITNAVPDGQVRYTTNGILPTLNDPLYAAAFPLRESARVLARTFVGESNVSASAGAWFISQTPAAGLYTRPFWLGVSREGNGSVIGGNAWLSSGQSTSVVAVAETYYYWEGWKGDISGLSTGNASMTVPMTTNRNLIAKFLQLTSSNGTPYEWLAHYFEPGNYDVNADSDVDQDGAPAWKEYIAGTDPTNMASVFRVSRMVHAPASVNLTWPGSTGRVYSIYQSDRMDAAGAWVPVAADIPGDGSDTMSYSNPVTTNPSMFYRVNVRLPTP